MYVRALVKLGERRQKTALLNSPNHKTVLFRMQWQSSSFSEVRKLKSRSFCTYAKLQNNRFEICTYKNKELKTYCNQHLQKNRARADSFHYCGTAGSDPGFRIASGRDEDSG
jgi:hypothetical protein